MDKEFFEKQFLALRQHIDTRFDDIENRLGAVENRLGAVENRLGAVENRLGAVENRLGAVEKWQEYAEGQFKEIFRRLEVIERYIHRLGLEIEAIKTDIKLVAEGHLMLNEKFDRLRTETLEHAITMRNDVLTLYRTTYGDLERRVKALETIR
jgi:archaellum component FlaC